MKKKHKKVSAVAGITLANKQKGDAPCTMDVKGNWDWERTMIKQKEEESKKRGDKADILHKKNKKLIADYEKLNWLEKLFTPSPREEVIQSWQNLNTT